MATKKQIAREIGKDVNDLVRMGIEITKDALVKASYPVCGNLSADFQARIAERFEKIPGESRYNPVTATKTSIWTNGLIYPTIGTVFGGYFGHSFIGILGGLYFAGREGEARGIEKDNLRSSGSLIGELISLPFDYISNVKKGIASQKTNLETKTEGGSK